MREIRVHVVADESERFTRRADAESRSRHGGGRPDDGQPPHLVPSERSTRRRVGDDARKRFGRTGSDMAGLVSGRRGPTELPRPPAAPPARPVRRWAGSPLEGTRRRRPAGQPAGRGRERSARAWLAGSVDAPTASVPQGGPTVAVAGSAARPWRSTAHTTAHDTTHSTCSARLSLRRGRLWPSGRRRRSRSECPGPSRPRRSVRRGLAAGGDAGAGVPADDGQPVAEGTPRVRRESPARVVQRQRRSLARRGGVAAAPVPADQSHHPRIAAWLVLSRNTVSSQVSSMYRRLGVSSRGEPVQQATAIGLLGG